jgi:hypothetical protein
MKNLTGQFGLVYALGLAAALTIAPAMTSAGVSEEEELQILRQGFGRALAYAETRGDLYNGNGEVLNREQKMALWTTWAAIQDHMARLDGLRAGLNRWFEIKNKTLRRRRLVREYALFLTGYRYAMIYIERVQQNPALEVLLNEPVPELGLEAGRYKSFKFHFLNVARAAEFAAFEVLFKIEHPPDSAWVRAILEDREIIWRMGRGKGYKLTAQNAAAIIKDNMKLAWFPVQKGISTWMGDTRVRRGDSALISMKQASALVDKLQPGDILLERREWYLSNLGLPGFWTHVALYVGTAEERTALFKGAALKEWLAGMTPAADSLESLLASRYPEAYRESRGFADGHPFRIIEAIAEGVCFTTLEHSAAADSLAVLRPRLSLLEKARAVLRAFHYSGRPYDYNFDFQTDAALVCSELVYKVYEPSRHTKGLRFDLTQLMGRWLLPPNELARLFDTEFGRVGQQTDLVVFLDGYESIQRAVEADARAFRQTWRRPKWHILIQGPAQE